MRSQIAVRFELLEERMRALSGSNPQSVSHTQVYGRLSWPCDGVAFTHGFKPLRGDNFGDVVQVAFRSITLCSRTFCSSSR